MTPRRGEGKGTKGGVDVGGYTKVLVCVVGGGIGGGGITFERVYSALPMLCVVRFF